jgi:hypothetical protein
MLKQNPATVTPTSRFTPPGKEKFNGETSWVHIVEWTKKDYGEGKDRRNEWAYSAALRAKTHNRNYTDTLEALRNEPEIDGLPDSEIISAVNSAYKGK